MTKINPPTPLSHWQRELLVAFRNWELSLTPDRDGLSFASILDILLAMANYQIMAQHRDVSAFIYPADTLFILSENQDTTVSRLMDWGKKWRADSVEVTDGTNEDYGWKLQRSLSHRLEAALWGESIQSSRNAVVISYWWD